MVGGVLYVSTSLAQVAGFDAATGEERWVYDPESWKSGTPPDHGFVHRGVAYWESGPDKRILLGTGDAYLICLDAATGKLIPSFGTGGRVDLTKGLVREFDRQGVTVDDFMDYSPELRKAAVAILGKYDYGPLFTPPNLTKPTVTMPGVAGGASWAGAAWDPETASLFVPSIARPFASQLAKSPLPSADYIGGYGPVEDYHGLPIFKPPYGRITAIDMRSGDHRWMKPLGDISQTHPLLKPLKIPPTGGPARGHSLATKTLLIVGQEGNTLRAGQAARGFAMAVDFGIHEPKVMALDKRTGDQVGEVPIPRNITGAPMTYIVNGKQFIAFPTGGANLPTELIALAAP